jgi:hypothetical protein
VPGVNQIERSRSLTYDGPLPVGADLPGPDALFLEVVPPHHQLVQVRALRLALEQNEAASSDVRPQSGGAVGNLSRKESWFVY